MGRIWIIYSAVYGSKESAAPQNQWEILEGNYSFQHFQLTHCLTSTIVTKQLCSKNLSHIELTVLKVIKPAGSAKCSDRLTLLIITNMDGSDHRKLAVIRKSKTPQCLKKKVQNASKGHGCQLVCIKECLDDWRDSPSNYEQVQYSNENGWPSYTLCVWQCIKPQTI